MAEDWFAALCPVPGKSVPLKYLPKFKPERLYANREKLSMSARQAAALAASAISNRVVLEPVFIAHRKDGLGARLSAMVGAMILAELTGGGFRFAWPRMSRDARAYHDVAEDAAEVFAGDFLQAHLIAQEDFDESRPVDLVPEVVGALRQGRVAPGTMISVQNFMGTFPLVPAKSRGSRLVEAFAGIGFSAPMEEARAMAAGAALPTADVTAIHLRAGDIVYGHYSKRHLAGEKAIPYPLAIDLIARLRAEGTPPLLFGQDADLLAHLRDDHGAYCADDIGDRAGFSPAQNALFDICLLGRCGRIIGGDSAFCKLGAAVAGIEVETPESLYEADEAVGIIERHVSDPDASPLISGKQKVFAARYAFMLAGETIARDERFWRLLELARENDPENPLLQFVYACSLYGAGREGEAEAMLSDIVAARPALAEGVVNLLTSVRRLPPLSPHLPPGRRRQIENRRDPCAPYMDALAVQARSGHPMAAFCCAVYFIAKDCDEADEMIAIVDEAPDKAPGHGLRRIATRLQRGALATRSVAG